MRSVSVWAATRSELTASGQNPQSYLYRHLFNMAVGLVLAVIAARVDLRRLRLIAPALYLGCLLGGPYTVSDLMEALGMEQSAVSHQLRVLREHRLFERISDRLHAHHHHGVEELVAELDPASGRRGPAYDSHVGISGTPRAA